MDTNNTTRLPATLADSAADLLAAADEEDVPSGPPPPPPLLVVPFLPAPLSMFRCLLRFSVNVVVIRAAQKQNLFTTFRIK